MRVLGTLKKNGEVQQLKEFTKRKKELKMDPTRRVRIFPVNITRDDTYGPAEKTLAPGQFPNIASVLGEHRSTDKNRRPNGLPFAPAPKPEAGPSTADEAMAKEFEDMLVQFQGKQVRKTNPNKTYTPSYISEQENVHFT